MLALLYNGAIIMRRSRITITLQQKTLEKIDRFIDGERIRNRSHAIEFILNTYLHTSIRKAVILAGGKGTKLRPYTYEIPKSLLPIKGKPLLEYIIENIKACGITDIIICTGYLGEKIKEYFSDGQKYGVHITYSQEHAPLQTGGALLKVKSFLQNEPFLLIYGDTLTNLHLKDFVDFHIEHKSTATIALTTVPHPSDFGQLTLHGIQLVNFYQKNKHGIKSNLINCGIYVFQPEIFEFFSQTKKSFFLEDVIEHLISKRKVNGFVFEGQWFDVGNPNQYEKAIKEFKISPYQDQKSSQ